jgi:hypothetical protein
LFEVIFVLLSLCHFCSSFHVLEQQLRQVAVKAKLAVVPRIDLLRSKINSAVPRA